MADLISLGTRLITEGPYKTEPTPRRIRGLFNKEWVFDTLEGVYVWEHKFYPYFYIPIKEFKNCEFERVEGIAGEGFFVARLTVGGRGTERVLVFEGEEGEGKLEGEGKWEGKGKELQGLVRVEWKEIDWWAEDEKLLGPHPKDPYKRVECLPSGRNVRIEVEGKVLSESVQNVFLFETGLRPRYYLNAGDVKWEYLEESETTSYCPYKGMANYYHLNVNGKQIKDAVWYYKYPTSESALVAGKLCFYNEKVDVFIDEVREEKYTDARL